MTGNTGFHLDVGDGHQIWLQPWGNPEGLPVLFLHGGPGSGCNPGQGALFDPARHRVIFMDQRGAGQSLPQRGRAANSTAHVLADIEMVRRHCGIERWLGQGGCRAFPGALCRRAMIFYARRSRRIGWPKHGRRQN